MHLSDYFIKIISTCFFVGYLPLIPGTFGSACGAFLYYLSRNNFCLYSIFLVGALCAGFLLSGKAEEIFQQKDSRRIVIDEVAGILISFLFIPYDLKLMLVGFFIFRALDALKPYPINKIQTSRGSMGVMGDDILAGVYTNIILQVVLRFVSFKGS